MTKIPTAYKNGVLPNAVILTGGIEGNPSADVVVYVFGPAAGNEASVLYAQEVKNYAPVKLYSFTAKVDNVVVMADNLAPNDKDELTAATRHLRSSPP